MNLLKKTCKCGIVFLAKESDVKRGWAKSCSKSCAANRREKILDRNNYNTRGKIRQGMPGSQHRFST